MRRFPRAPAAIRASDGLPPPVGGLVSLFRWSALKVTNQPRVGAPRGRL